MEEESREVNVIFYLRRGGSGGSDQFKTNI